MDFHGELTDDEDFVEVLNVVMHPRRPKVYRNRPNQFQKWSDEEFINRYQLSKQTVQYLSEEISHNITSVTNRNHALSATEMILVTLRFFAKGSFLQVNGDIHGMDKSTASRIIYKVSRVIASLKERYISMPRNEEELEKSVHGFYNISRFPRCIGTIDCTHIKIQSPGGNDAENYRNRKGFFSINTQVICNYNFKIANIVCRWPGSSHDSNIFRNSAIKARFENGEFNNNLIVGDSGYGVKTYLMTPLPHPQTAAEQLYNEAQIKTRNTIERCFGIWKRRFPILAMGIRLHITKVEAIVVAIAVLHNIAIAMNEEEPEVNDEVEAAINLINNVPNEDANALNNGVREVLINEYFARLL